MLSVNQSNHICYQWTKAAIFTQPTMHVFLISVPFSQYLNLSAEKITSWSLQSFDYYYYNYINEQI